jgi:hypothetical protein
VSFILIALVHLPLILITKIKQSESHNIWRILISLTSSPSGTDHDTHTIGNPILFLPAATQYIEASILLATVLRVCGKGHYGENHCGESHRRHREFIPKHVDLHNIPMSTTRACLPLLQLIINWHEWGTM